MTKIGWIKNSRVKIAPSSAAIDALNALIAEQPVISQEKFPTKKEWREKQMQVLAHHPIKPGRFVGRERSE